MLAELAAANAAFGILKQTIANGKELMSAGKAISDLINAEEDLRKRVKEKNALSGETWAVAKVKTSKSSWR